MWHPAPRWQSIISQGYPVYPGSSWIAAELCRIAGRQVYLELYDHSKEVRIDLQKAFHGRNVTIGESLKTTNCNQAHIETFEIRACVLEPRKKGLPTLMWMPTNHLNNAFDAAKQLDKRNPIAGAARLGYAWSAVYWKKNQSGGGWFLVYNIAHGQIRKTVDWIARAGGNWIRVHS
jgi:hypothetical protein